MEENTKQLLRVVEECNVCPRCGAKPCEMMSRYDTYHIGCAYCGVHKGITTFLDEPLSEKTKEKTKREWNRRCLSSKYRDGIFEAMGATAGDYVLARIESDEIVYITSDIKEAVNFALYQTDVYDIYIIMDNMLEQLKGSDLLKFAFGKL